MTHVQIAVKLPTPTGTGEPVPAWWNLHAKPTTANTSNHTILLPEPAVAPFVVDPADPTRSVASIILTPVDINSGWAWQLTLYNDQTPVMGVPVRTVIVPDSADVVWGDQLTDVNPDDLTPVGPPPVDRWELALSQATTAAVAAATAAANGSATAAASSATAAATARDGALTAESAAASSASAAAGSATAAASSAVNAANSANVALSASSTPVAVPAPPLEVAGAASASLKFGDIYAGSFMTTPGDAGFAPDANNTYGALWTRDHAYTVWHMPYLMSADQLAAFVRNRLATRSTAGMLDPDGGTFGTAGANFVCDRIAADGTVVYKNAGYSHLPFMDGIAFVILVLWVYYKMTGDTSLFTDTKAEIDTCLAALPTSSNGCVYSDPAAPSVDYGFTDSVKKTGNVAYGTALLAWAYKMLAEVAGESGTGGPYTTARFHAQTGLATLRKSSGWYMPSSGNEAAHDDVWATALIVAEGLCTSAEARSSALTLAAAYKAGTITQRGWVRHLPQGQYWANALSAVDVYHNGGYWLTPLWDCYRAVATVNPQLAVAWASEAMAEVQRQIVAQATVGVKTAPYEWYFNYNAGVLGYTASAAIAARFTSKPSHAYSVLPGTGASSSDDFTTGTPGWTLTGFTWNSSTKQLVSNGVVDGETAIKSGISSVADTQITADCTYSNQGNTFFGLILRYTDDNNYIFASVGGVNNEEIDIYEKIGGSVTTLGFTGISHLTAGTVYRVQAKVIGNQVTLTVNGQSFTATTSLMTAGKAGVRHGRIGTGYTTYDNIVIGAAAPVTIPSDLILADDAGITSPGNIASGIVGEYRLLNAAGQPVAIGHANGAIGITGPLD